MDKPPDNAKFQMDMKLNQLIQDNVGKSVLCNNVRGELKMVQTIENAIIQYRRSVGSSSDQGQLKMLVWMVLDLETNLELAHDRMDQPQWCTANWLRIRTYTSAAPSRTATTSTTPVRLFQLVRLRRLP